MHCNQCGLEVPENYKFCPKCGAEVAPVNNPVENKQDELLKRLSSGEITSKEYDKLKKKIEKEEKKSSGKSIKKKTSKKKIVLMIVIGLIAFFIMDGIGASMMKPNNTTINPQGNVQQQIDDIVNNVANDNSLTDTQKSIIKDIQQTCDSNEAMASLQSNTAAQTYHKICYEKIYDQIKQFEQKNAGNKTS